jgi:hypothetical protein
MSALNGIVQPGAVYLLTDGATYRWNGVVRDIGPKVITLEAAQMAIGWSGCGVRANLEKAIKRSGARSRAEVMAVLPWIVRDHVGRNIAREPECNPADLGLSLLIALWNNGPELYALHSDQVVIGPNLPAFRPIKMQAYLDIEPTVATSIFGRQVNPLDPASFDAAVDGLAVIEHQRRQPFEDANGDRRFMVGGFAQLTTVSAAGIETRVLREWPDKVGRKIEPEPCPEKEAVLCR